MDLYLIIGLGVVLAIIIIAIIIDGLRRKRRYYDEIKVDAVDKSKHQEEDDDPIFAAPNDHDKFPILGDVQKVSTQEQQELHLINEKDFNQIDFHEEVEFEANEVRANIENQVDLKEFKPLIVIHIMGKEGNTFGGYQLLQTILSTGLRFGKMNIFHKFKSNNDREKIIYSLASAVEPGTFDMSKMGSFNCPGLTLFMDLEQQEKPFEALTAMYETAENLAEDLDGNLLTDKQAPFTLETLQHYKHQIEHFFNIENLHD